MQVIDIVDRLFVAMFDYLNENCKTQFEAIDRQYPFEPLKVKYINHLQTNDIRSCL